MCMYRIEQGMADELYNAVRPLFKNILKTFSMDVFNQSLVIVNEGPKIRTCNTIVYLEGIPLWSKYVMLYRTGIGLLPLSTYGQDEHNKSRMQEGSVDLR